MYYSSQNVQMKINVIELTKSDGFLFNLNKKRRKNNEIQLTGVFNIVKLFQENMCEMYHVTEVYSGKMLTRLVLIRYCGLQGKFIRIHFGTQGKIAGADIEFCK